jgi:hypothetical protein
MLAFGRPWKLKVSNIGSKKRVSSAHGLAMGAAGVQVFSMTKSGSGRMATNENFTTAAGCPPVSNQNRQPTEGHVQNPVLKNVAAAIAGASDP